MSEQEWREAYWHCERWLDHRRPVSGADMLGQAAAALQRDARPDRYGEGPVVATFERRIAKLLGKPAAALLPSGTMARRAALRIHCDRRGSTTVGFHPTCHLELNEQAAYAHLHGLKAELIGDRDRLITLADLEALHAPIGALLIELPQRAIGGRLPRVGRPPQADRVGARGIEMTVPGRASGSRHPVRASSRGHRGALRHRLRLVVQGAVRLCRLPGGRPEGFIDEIRVWRHRHGGTLWNLFPLAASAQRGLDELVPQMPRFLEHARALALALRELPGVSVVPDPPQRTALPPASPRRCGDRSRAGDRRRPRTARVAVRRLRPERGPGGDQGRGSAWGSLRSSSRHRRRRSCSQRSYRPSVD